MKTETKTSGKFAACWNDDHAGYVIQIRTNPDGYFSSITCPVCGATMTAGAYYAEAGTSILLVNEAGIVQSHLSYSEFDFNEQVKIFRRALRTLCKSLKVRRGRGTGYAWIKIRGSEEYGGMNPEELEAMGKFGMTREAYDYNTERKVTVAKQSISPDSRYYYFIKALYLDLENQIYKRKVAEYYEGSYISSFRKKGYVEPRGAD